jgi:rSAM/selenodomain-associated transferase 1
MVVMAKASVPGAVKTRLVPPLSPEQAADLNTAFLRDAADLLRAARRLANIRGRVAYAPKGSEAFFQRTLPSMELIETAAADFGDCLLHAAATALAAGYGAVCLLNADSPTLPVGYLVAAATILATDEERAVLGPSTDGGYYLLGIKRAHRELFRDVAWSSERVFGQTLTRARALALPVVTLPTWYDVDDLDGLRRLAGELLHGEAFRTVGDDRPEARHTRAWLQALDATGHLASTLRHK